MSNEQFLSSELYTQNLLLAEDPSTEPTTLEGLSNHKSPLVRHAVAQNPNTPVSVLGVLSAAYSKEVLFNPSMPLLFLEDPNFLLRFPEAGLLKMLSSGALPREYLSLITRHPSPKVQFQVALSPRLPTSFLQALIKRDSLATLLAEHPRTPASTLYLLLGHAEAGVRLKAASHPNAPKRLLSIMRFLGVSFTQRALHPSFLLLRSLLSPRERLLLRECGPFGEELLSQGQGPRYLARAPSPRYCRIGRNRKVTQSSYWRATLASR